MKKRARLNCIAHLLTQVPYKDLHLNVRSTLHRIPWSRLTSIGTMLGISDAMNSADLVPPSTCISSWRVPAAASAR